MTSKVTENTRDSLEKVMSGAKLEERENRSTSFSPAIEDQERVPKIHLKTVILIIAVYLVYVAGVFNIVAAGAYGHDIGIALGGPNQATWLVQSVTIIITVLSPMVSEAADFWGRKWLLVGLTFSGIVGCVVTGAAKSMGMALAGQVISGIACSSQPLVHAIPSEVLPRRVRSLAQAGVNISAVAGTVISLLVGGALVRNNNNDGFRTLFYINAGLFGISTVCVAALYNPPLRELQIKLTQREKLARLDWVGFFLLSSGLVLFCMSLVWSQNPYAWTNVHILAPFIIGVILILCLITYETRFKKDGIFHHSLFKRDRNFGLAIGCMFVEGLVFFSCNNYFAFEVSTLYESDSLIVGVRYSICFFAYAVSTSLTGLYATSTKTLRLPIVIGFALFLAFMIAMATATVGSSTAVWGYSVLFGLGLGIVLNALMTAAQLGTPPELITTASGLIISTRNLGGSIALAIYNALFTQQLSKNLNSRVPAAVLPLGLPPSSIGLFISVLTSGETAGLSNIPGVTGTIIQAGGHAVLESFAVGFRYVWITAGCFTFVAMVAACFLRDPEKEFNDSIDAPAE